MTSQQKDKPDKPDKTTNAVPVDQRPTVTIDVDFYQNIIHDPDVSETRKRELIEIVGNIALSFIDLGFNVHPVQLARQEKHQHQILQSEKERLLERSDI